MTNPAALRSKRPLQLVGLLGMSIVAVLVSVRTPAGIQGSGFRSLAVIGTVTAVGDGIAVGDVTYPTRGATFKIDGEPGNQAQLRDGGSASENRGHKKCCPKMSGGIRRFATGNQVHAPPSRAAFFPPESGAHSR
jgi:hypothetical protein